VQPKTRTRPKAKLLDQPERAPLVGPQSFDEWFNQTWRAVEKKDASAADREEFQRLLELRPKAAKLNGDLPALYHRQASERTSIPLVQESIAYCTRELRTQLAGNTPSPLEALLVDVIVGCHSDYWLFAFLVKQKEHEGFTLDDMEKWERILASKETRYLRAIVELARVRRLLNLPAPQVNINLPGGQQVNVQGDVKP
jgi:hypothetical protein